MTTSTNTFTFLFTDIQDSTKLWEKHPEAMQQALARHDDILRQTIEAHDGIVFKTVGDAFCAAFTDAGQALQAGVEIQQTLLQTDWPGGLTIKIRMGLHTGEAEKRDNDFFGTTVNRVARVMSLGHGGQTIISSATYALLKDQSLDDVTFADLGRYELKGLSEPEQIYQVNTPDLPIKFPPLNMKLKRSISFSAQHFVERSELQPLFQKLDETNEHGIGGTFLISGEPGIGKSTMIEYFLAGCDQWYVVNSLTAIGRCLDMDGVSRGYLPWKEVLLVQPYQFKAFPSRKRRL